jgi:hypothetical protein
MTYPNIALHFGHLIPMYISIFPATNNEIAPYKTVLNNSVGIYFSANANMTIAEKPTATKVKYKFFRLFIMSLGINMAYLFSCGPDQQTTQHSTMSSIARTRYRM